jgi:hypothetical protein
VLVKRRGKERKGEEGKGKMKKTKTRSGEKNEPPTKDRVAASGCR